MKFDTAIEKFMHMVPGCPWTEAVDALRYAVIEFCERSTALTYWSEKPSNAIAFDVGVDAQTVPIAIFDAYVGASQVTALSTTDMAPDDEPHLRFDPAQLHNSITVAPAPVVPVTVRLLMAWAPTPWATDFPDHLWLRRQETLKAGALARLLSEPGAPYVNAGAAGQYDGIFVRGIEDARLAAAMNRATPVRRLRVRPADESGARRAWSSLGMPPAPAPAPAPAPGPGPGPAPAPAPIAADGGDF